MRPIKTLLLILISAIFAIKIPLTSVADDSLTKSVIDEIKLYDFSFSELLQEHFMVVEFEAESSADSLLLFRSKGKMRRLRTKTGEYEVCVVNPEVLTDDRKVKSENPLSTPCTDEHIVVKGKVWSSVQTADGNGKLTRSWVLVDEQYKRFHFLPNFRCIHLSDWPFVVESSFDASNSKGNIVRDVYLGSNRCFRAREISKGVVESSWTISPKSNGLGVLECRDGLPVKRQSYSFPFIYEPEKELPDLKKGVLESSVETQWAKLPGDVDVPRLVNANFFDNSREDPSSIQFVAKIKVFLPESPEYEAAFTKFEEICRQTTGSDDKPNEK